MKRVRPKKSKYDKIMRILFGYFACCLLSFGALTAPLHAEGGNYHDRVTAPRTIATLTMPLSKDLHFSGTALYDNALYGTFGYGSLDYALAKDTSLSAGYIYFNEPDGDVMMMRYGVNEKFKYEALKVMGRLLIETHFTTRPQHEATYQRLRPLLHVALELYPDSKFKPELFSSFETVFATHYHKPVERLDYAAGIKFKPLDRISMTMSYYRWHWTVANKKDSQGLRTTLNYTIPYKENGVAVDTTWEAPADVLMGAAE